MAQSRVARKSSRHKRNHPSESAQDTPRQPHKEHAANAEASIDRNESANDAKPGQAEQKPMLPALVPQCLPAMIVQPPSDPANDAPVSKWKFSTGMQALLISVCLTAVLIFSIGALKVNRSDTRLAAADASASLAIPASESGNATSVNKASVTHPVHHASKSAGTTSKAGASGTLKKSALARTEHAAHAPADKAKKKSTAIAAKAPRKPLDEHSVPLLAQNSIVKPVSTQEQYAQCEGISSFFRREQCKWQVCGGKWGQDGCPSYQSENREIN
ncbi:hypothetical protein [Noviherbaspirillum sp.]|uniref:hypothetical protein n=1 Tax=Noviherbaspirillum sp. TaxID=1926288 RepID=UPI002B4A3D7E|nr:hypothetical protein [Noviherbaspirillum sp.]HJV82602.1 hypothetical protein [Noviherbaspirillum sp.]